MRRPPSPRRPPSRAPRSRRCGSPARSRASSPSSCYGDEAPIATANFVALARCGFYDGIWFHRILAGFVIQAGDPGTKGRTGDFDGIGTGGPGYQFEIEPPAEGLTYEPYSVSMANDTLANGSQFFVALVDLDWAAAARRYTIFGQVTSGTDTVDAIAAVPVNDPQVGVPLDAGHHRVDHHLGRRGALSRRVGGPGRPPTVAAGDIWRPDGGCSSMCPLRRR